MLYHLACTGTTTRAALIAGGCIQELVWLLCDTDAQPKALEAASYLLAAFAAAEEPDPGVAFLAAGGTTVLAPLLRHTSSKVQGAAMAALKGLLTSSNPAVQAVCVAAGTVQPIVTCLLSGSDTLWLKHAAGALANLTAINPDAATAAAEAGAVPRLLQLPHGNRPEVQLSATIAMHNVAALMALQQEGPAALAPDLAAAGAIPTAAHLLRSQRDTIVPAAGAALVSLLARDSERRSVACVAAGVVSSLVGHARSEDRILARTATDALRHLAASSAEAVGALEQAGLGPPPPGWQGARQASRAR